MVKLSEIELKMLVKGGETNTVELKLAAPRAVDLAERLCGMANARGGIVGLKTLLIRLWVCLMSVLEKRWMSFYGPLGKLSSPNLCSTLYWLLRSSVQKHAHREGERSPSPACKHRRVGVPSEVVTASSCSNDDTLM